MSGTPRDGTDLITAAELAVYGLTPGDVRRRCPWAVEYAALDDSPCWRRGDLTCLTEGEDGTEEGPDT